MADKNSNVGAGTTRRLFLKSAGAAVGGGDVLDLTPAFWRTAAPAETIRIGFVSPLTGALAGFGECGLVKKSLVSGLQIGERSYAVDILLGDTQSDPHRAARLAKDMVTNYKVDLMLSCPATNNPASRQAGEARGRS
jgi:branched-chain amino acid transport system substrate-binding protein